MSAAVAPLEMTLQEARDRVELAYGLFDKAHRQVESLLRINSAQLQEIDDTRRLYYLYRTLDLLDRQRNEPFTDYLSPIYDHVGAARARISTALERDGIRSTLGILREDPERFGDVMGKPGSISRDHSFWSAEQLGRQLEQLLLERTPRRSSVSDEILRPRDLDLSAARHLPGRVSELRANWKRSHPILVAAINREGSVERSLAEAARLTGGTYFAQTHLGPDAGLAVSAALEEHPQPEGIEPTHFSRFQARVQDVDEIVGQIEIFVSAKKELQTEEASLGSKLRSEHALIDRRSSSLAALARDRAAFQSHLAEAYRPDSLAAVHEALKRHTRAHGRVATAVNLKEEPSRFGRLQGLPGSPARRWARIGATEAAHRLRAFETHRRDLLALPGRRPAWHLQRLEAELAQIRGRLAHIPPLRGYQRQLARALDAAGGLRRVASYFSAPALSHIDRALRVVRSLEGGHER